MLTIYNTNYWEIIIYIYIYIIIIHIMNILQVRLITVTHSMCVYCGFWWSLLLISAADLCCWSPETTSNTQAMSKFDQFNM